MTAEEYVVQRLQEAEEKFKNAKKLADLKTIVNLFLLMKILNVSELSFGLLLLRNMTR